MSSSPASQRGSAIIYVFIFIALFAALSYAVSRGMRVTDTNRGNQEKVALATSDILAFANAVQNGVKGVMTVNGCTDTQISFDTPRLTGYTNPSAPVDKSCNIFDAAGAGVTFVDPPQGALNPQFSADANYGKWIFTGRFCFLDVGSGGSSCTASNSELALMLIAVSEDVCRKVESMFDVSGFQDFSNGSVLPAFQGVYGSNLIQNDARLSGKHVFCFAYLGNYKLVYTLLPR